MKKFVLINLFLLTLVFIVGVFAQNTGGKSKNEKQDFSGKWIFNSDKSTGNVAFMMITDNKNKDLKCYSELVITHKDPELNIQEKTECNFPQQLKPQVTGNSMTYFTDERGETNTVENNAVSSKTKWSGNKILITFYGTENGKKVPGKMVELKLSKGGKVLTQKSDAPETFNTPNSRDPFNFNQWTIVFDRAN